MASRTARKRDQNRCIKCNQELSHAALNRHKNPAVCPGKQTAQQVLNDIIADDSESFSVDESLDQLDYSNYHTENCESSEQEQQQEQQEQQQIDSQLFTSAILNSDYFSSGSSNTDSSSESTLSEDTIVVSDTEEIDNFDSLYVQNTAVTEVSKNAQVSSSDVEEKEVKSIIFHICLFLSFFQLFYRISERGISLLLEFIKCLLTWLLSLCSQSRHLQLLRDHMPSNVYFLKKLLGDETNIDLQVVCPKCNSLYKFTDCIIRHWIRDDESAACSFIEYPNHPQLARRKKCNTVLLKRIKHGSSYKLIPKKVYAYCSLTAMISKLCNKSSFLAKCEHWRDSFQPFTSIKNLNGLLTDIYNGEVWYRYQIVDEKPFLAAPNNLALILNLDWFTPFKHIQYSIGILYAVVANLPRSERYKLDNVIIIGCIPGPKEPKKM